MANEIFKSAGSGASNHQSVFDLSHDKKFTANFGYLYPVFNKMANPGDRWNVIPEIIVRINPLISPVLHDIIAHLHFYFTPLRLVDKNFTKFSGADSPTGEYIGTVPLAGFEANGNKIKAHDLMKANTSDSPGTQNPVNLSNPEGYVSDMIYNLIVAEAEAGTSTNYEIPEDSLPVAWPLRCYKYIWNEFFRDANIQSKIRFDEDQPSPEYRNDFNLLTVNHTKDRFTSMSLLQQRGTSPALPITGMGSVIFPNIGNITSATEFNVKAGVNGINLYASKNVSTNPGAVTIEAQTNNQFQMTQMKAQPADASALQNIFNNNSIDTSQLTSVSINELRTAIQQQRWMERSARAGTRYNELLIAHHGIAPHDETLGRPKYLGGMKAPIMISEVLQTSESGNNTKQGNMAGHGICLASQKVCDYTVKEYGIITGVMFLRPKLQYANNRIDKEWLIRTKEELYWQEYQHLSEQAILGKEMHVNQRINNTNGVAIPDYNNKIIGYQSIYSEYKSAHSTVHGLFRTPSFASWHCARYLNKPLFNSSFITVNNTEFNRILAVTSQPAFLVSIGFKVKAARRISFYSDPGLMDHF